MTPSSPFVFQVAAVAALIGLTVCVIPYFCAQKHRNTENKTEASKDSENKNETSKDSENKTDASKVPSDAVEMQVQDY